MTTTIDLYEAGRLPTPLKHLAVHLLQRTGCGNLALASPHRDPATTIVCVPAHAVTAARVVIAEVMRRYGSPLMDAYTGGSLPGEAEAVQ